MLRSVVFLGILASLALSMQEDGNPESPGRLVKVNYCYGDAKSLPQNLQRSLRLVAVYGSKLSTFLQDPIHPPQEALSEETPKRASGNARTPTNPHKDRRMAERISKPRTIDFSKSNCAFIRLVVEKREELEEFILVKTDSGISFVPQSMRNHTDKEVCFISGSVEQKAACAPFSWMNVGEYELCQKQSFRDENYRLGVVLKFIAMRSDDPDSLFCQFTKENKALSDEVKRFASLPEEEKNKSIDIIFKELSIPSVYPFKLKMVSEAVGSYH